MSATKLKGQDTFGKNDPYVQIGSYPSTKKADSKEGWSEKEFRSLAQTKVVVNSNDPKFTPVTVPDVGKLAQRDTDKILFVVWDDDDGKKLGNTTNRDMIGLGYATLKDCMSSAGAKVPLFNPKKSKVAGDAGTLMISAKSDARPSDSRSREPARDDRDARDARDSRDSRDRRPDPSRRPDAGRDSNRDRSAGGDDESIKALKDMASYQLELAERKVQDARDELDAAKKLLEKVERLEPRRRPADVDRRDPGDRRYDLARRYSSSSEDDYYRGPRPMRAYSPGPPPPRYGGAGGYGGPPPPGPYGRRW